MKTGVHLLTVYPHHGVHRIRFGMSRGDVELAMGIVPIRLKSSEFSLIEDVFEPLGLNVIYDQADTAAAVSVTAGLGADLDYGGYHLFSHSAREVRNWARSRDPQLEQEYGFLSRALGLGMWADWIDVPDLDETQTRAPAASFTVFRRGYNEEEDVRLGGLGRRASST
jgi:hypothetical protein